MRVWQNRPNDALRDRDLPARRFSPNQMYAAMFAVSAGIPVPIDQATYIALMPHRRVLQPGAGFKINNLTYWSDKLQPLTKMRPPTRDGRWEVHADPYDPDRVWVADPAGGEWIGCVSTSYRLDGFPFASALRKLRNAPQADEGLQDRWAEELLAERPERLSKKRAAKRNVVLAQRERDAEPRPAAIPDPDPPRSVSSVLVDEFRVVGPDEELWNAT